MVVDGWCIERYGMHQMWCRNVSISSGRPVNEWLCEVWCRVMVVYGRCIKQQRLHRMRSGEVSRVVRAEYDQRVHLMCCWFLVIGIRRHQPIAMYRMCGWSVLLIIWSVDEWLCEVWCRVMVVYGRWIEQQRLHRMCRGQVFCGCCFRGVCSLSRVCTRTMEWCGRLVQRQ